MKAIYLTPLLSIFLLSCGNKLLKQAESDYNNYEYASASTLYENYLKTTSDNGAMLHLADCYRHMNRHADADLWYAKAIGTADASANDKLNYAEVLREEGKYTEAAAMFNEYLQMNPADASAQDKQKACLSPEQFSTADPFYTVSKVKFVSGDNLACFSPFLSGSQLYFSEAAPMHAGMKADNYTGDGFLDIYVADANSLNATPLAGTVNTDLHEATPVISPDGNTMYFTRSRMIGKKPGQAKNNDNHLEICQAVLSSGMWTNVTSLPFNNNEYSCGHPALTNDGKRMFFISDMPGGKGGTDIWYSDLDNGAWSAPANVTALNTTGDEMFPTVHGENEFYYSSDEVAGAGGLDIIKCAMSNGMPSAGKRMSAPFNSSADDFGIVFTADGRSGYFSSNRDQADGSDFIYRFDRRDPKFYVKTIVKDKASGDLVKNVNIEVKNATTGKDFILITDEQGSIFFPSDSLNTYNFCLKDQSYFACYAGGTTGGFKGTFSDTTYITLTPEKIVINKPIRLENIYYDYNKWNIRPDAAIELDKLVQIMVDNPQIKIELSSHTDSRGSDNFNMKLSQKRAQAAVDYIVSKGVSKDRITAKGYGESVPLNRCVNGVKCTEDEWQFNRRTEFKVTSLIQQ